jgi:hypothetical protein
VSVEVDVPGTAGFSQAKNARLTVARRQRAVAATGPAAERFRAHNWREQYARGSSSERLANAAKQSIPWIHQPESPVSRIEFAKVIVMLSIVLGLPAAMAQTPAPNPAPNMPPAEPKTPVVAQGDIPRDAADARHCLELAANNEIIACAEKYRARKARI